jgi:HPt (histidine-containing phosphotransfer) domain-containing protein
VTSGSGVPAEAPIDPAVVESLRRLGERTGRDLFRELTTLFLSAADTQVGTARQLLARGDFAELARVAHGLKGSSSVIGGRRVAAAAAALESTVAPGSAAPTGVVTSATDGDSVGAALRRCTDELELFRTAVRELSSTG